MVPGSSAITATLLIVVLVPIIVYATNRYYGTYLSYGSGDTVIATFHAHGGPPGAGRKWNVECLDGEAVVGFQDFVNDFQKIEIVWCKFMFPYKPPTNGLYPFYPNCHIRNYTTEFFCFDPARVQVTVNTFVTGIWDNELQFFVARKGTDDVNNYKCCKAPTGYYIDYQSCYYMPTHDQYWEYYDSLQHIITYCASGYVVTGIAKKINPFDFEYHIEYIQCCRLGFAPGPQLQQYRRIKRDSGEDVGDAEYDMEVEIRYSHDPAPPNANLTTATTMAAFIDNDGDNDVVFYSTESSIKRAHQLAVSM